MNDGLYRVLLTRKERSSNKVPFVFHLNGHRISESYVSHRLKKAVRKAGLSDKLHFHSLRHSHASWLVQGGVSLYEVQKLLGHSSISVSEAYSHLLPDTLHDSVNKIRLEFLWSQTGSKSPERFGLPLNVARSTPYSSNVYP